MLGKVEICGINTSELKVLSAKECRELLIRAQNGDQNACDALVEGNLRLVLSVIQRFASRGENMDDLFQVGCIGLIKAIRNFDTNLDVRFSTYGVPMIAGEIRRYLRDNSPIRIPRSTRDTAYHVLQTKEQLVYELNREPTIDEIADKMKISRQEIVYALEAITDPVSFFDLVNSESGENFCIMDHISDPRSSDARWLDRIAINSAINKLEEREKKILCLRYFSGRTQAEVASEIGISQAQVSRLEKSALFQIRRNISAS